MCVLVEVVTAKLESLHVVSHFKDTIQTVKQYMLSIWQTPLKGLLIGVHISSLMSHHIT